MGRVKTLMVLALAACNGGGSTAPVSTPPVASVSAGDNHSCGLTPEGAAYCWGDNTFGELGNGTMTGSTTPVAVSGGRRFVVLSAGSRHTCGLTPAGAAYCWGSNPTGQVGNGTTNDASTPVPVSDGLTFAALSAGGFHTCGITTAGAAYCWGSNLEGQLGAGTSSGPNTCGASACSETPVAVLGGLTFIAVSAGEFHTCGVTSANAAYCWGYNFDGVLGTPPRQSCSVNGYPCNVTPGAVAGGLAFDAVSAATLHTCGITTAGAAYCWGDNGGGGLGDGSTTSSSTPVAVAGGLSFSVVSAGDNHSCGVTPAGAAYCWGENNSGQLGNGTIVSSTSPVPVSGGLTFAALSGGHRSHHSCGVTQGKAAYCWGSNANGQLGNGTTMDSPVPTLVGP